MIGEFQRPRVAVTHDESYEVGAYLQAIEAAGGEPIAVTPASGASARDFDAIVISGGVDVDPALYGQAQHEETEEPDRARDRLELEMLREALRLNLPLLAICRGLQLFNVAEGGTLHQHVDGHRQPSGDKAQSHHSIQVDPTSCLAQLLGVTEVRVNSRHHQAVDAVGAHLSISARAEDGTIEGLEHKGRDFAVAVQWHPENMAMTDAVQRRLFEGLIAAARAAER